MPIEVEAVYENGLLKLDGPLPLPEHQRVRVTIQTPSDWVERSYGMFGWKGSAEEADRVASDPELDYPPPQEGP